VEILPVVPAHSKAPRVRLGPALGIGLIVLAALGGLAYAAAYLFVGNGVLPHTTVAGVSIGRLSPSAAQAKVSAALAPRSTAAIPLKVGNQSLTVEPASAGLTVAVRARPVCGKRSSPTTSWHPRSQST
jgi:hypothetical protein